MNNLLNIFDFSEDFSFMRESQLNRIFIFLEGKRSHETSADATDIMNFWEEPLNELLGKTLWKVEETF